MRWLLIGLCVGLSSCQTPYQRSGTYSSDAKSTPSKPSFQGPGPFSSSYRSTSSMAEKKSPNSSIDLRWPLKNGRVTQNFISGRHSGIDIGAPDGAEIFSSHAGHVIYAGRGFSGYGKLVIIEDGEIATFYSHCQKLLVHQNQWIEQGQVIALVGMTGHATGPHLHFELRRSRVPTDPLMYLPHDTVSE